MTSASGGVVESPSGPTLRIRSSLTTTTAWDHTLPDPSTSFPNRSTFVFEAAKQRDPCQEKRVESTRMKTIRRPFARRIETPFMSCGENNYAIGTQVDRGMAHLEWITSGPIK